MILVWQRLKRGEVDDKRATGGPRFKVDNKSKSKSSATNQLAEPNQINPIGQLCMWRQANRQWRHSRKSDRRRARARPKKIILFELPGLPPDAIRADSQDAISSVEKTDFLECVHHSVPRSVRSSNSLVTGSASARPRSRLRTVFATSSPFTRI